MELKIDGMSCGHCEGRVRAELERLGAVVESVSAENKNAIVSGIDEVGAKKIVSIGEETRPSNDNGANMCPADRCIVDLGESVAMMGGRQ